MSDSDISTMLADQLDRLLDRIIDGDTLAAGEAGLPMSALAAMLAELRLEQALVSEKLGGAGLSWSDLGPSLAVLGYHACPAPLAEKIVVNAMVEQAGFAPPAAPVAPGDGSLAMDFSGRVSGSCTVSWQCAEWLLVDVANGDIFRTCLLDAAGTDAGRLISISREPRFRYSFRDAVPVAIADEHLPVGRVVAVLAALRAVQISGALARALFMSVDYGNSRSQFGRPIGKFQAVQHMIAELAAETAAARAAAELGLAALDRGCGWQSLAVAKIRASVAAGKGAMLAHQVHGAMGVTQEHRLHYFTRRLWQWRDEAGNEHAWSEKLGRYLLSQKGQHLWDEILALSGT